MHYRHAGHIVFWIVVITTLAWALYGRLDVAGIMFLTGLIFVEQTFAAARAEETAPFFGKLHLGALDAKIVTEPKTGPFKRLEWEADFKDVQPPFVLRATVRRGAGQLKADVRHLKAKLTHIKDLQEVKVTGNVIALYFKDQPGKTPGGKAALTMLEKAVR
ncbi:hypothetical protein HY994_05400 [Candidatus Micrarchaeota archaeon]|nr:hypothetical protein [Candidatus Micrarchaeota archaeon]